MYLRGSKWSLNRRRQRANPWFVVFLLGAIGFLVYINAFIIPTVPPPFVPTPTPTRSPESFSEEADAYMAEGRISLAMESYEAAIAANPQGVSNYLTLAKLQIYRNDYEKARVNAEYALLLDKSRPQAYALLGWAKGYMGEYLEAEADVRAALELDPNHALAHAVYADILARRVMNNLGEIDTIDRAIEQSTKALSLDPNLMESRWARGFVLEITGNYEEAIEQLEAALQINDTVAEINLALGRNYLAIEQFDLAVQQFTRAYSLNPTDPLPNWYISRVYARIGEFAKAVQYAEQAVNDAPSDPSMHGNLGSMYFRDLQFNRAIASLELAVRGGLTEGGVVVEGLPLNYSRTVMEFYSRYGLALARVNRCDEAVQIAQGMLQTVPDDDTSVFNAQEIINICQGFQEIPPAPEPEDEENNSTGFYKPDNSNETS